MNNKINQKAAKIKLLILDVDGVLTDGKIYISDSGIEYKGFYSKDGVGIKLLLKAGVEVAIISGRESVAVNHRMNGLGVKYIYQNQDDKIKAFDELKQDLNLKNEQIAYVGDDLPDLAAMLKSGLGIAVANAADTVKQQADWVTNTCGGMGAVREACELIMQAQNKF